MKRREKLKVAVVAILVVTTGCSVSQERHAQVADDHAVPFSLLDPHAAPLVAPASGPATEPVGVCFVNDGKLEVVPVPMDPPVGLDDVIAALQEPPAGATIPLRTALGDPSIVRSVRLEAGTAHVDLAGSVTDVGSQDQVLAIAQVVCSLTARPGVGRVAFMLDGAPVDVPRGDGSLTNQPVSRDDYAQLLG